MAAVFATLLRKMSPAAAYNLGFALYWLGWCLSFPMWVLGPRRLLRVAISGRTPSKGEAGLLLLPVVGAVATALWPNRKAVDPSTLAVMVSVGALNAVAEEILWRGLFLEEFPDDLIRGALWPLVGFASWHLAPQIVLPSRQGRWRFVLGAALVGAASTASAWRSGGVRNCLMPHLATDACGVVAARFRLGR